MAILNKELLASKKFKEHLNRIISEGDLSVLTATKIRQELEDIYRLERNSMKKQPWKDMLSAMIDEYTGNNEEEEQGENGDEAAKSDEDNVEKNEDETNDSDKHVKDEMDSDSQPDHKEGSPEHTNQKQDDESDNVKDVDDSDSDDSKVNSDSDMSESAASPPPQKKQRKKKTQPAKQQQTAKKGSGNKTTQDDESIKRLKSYINKCGVRKSWQKELAGCTTKKSQITKLKGILEELGVHGRPTIEKCESVKAERELKTEIDSLDTDNILATTDDGPSLRSSGLSAKRKRRPIINDDSDGSGDNDTGAPLDVSFLGDQSDSDSD